jgi:hypothetical protein
MLLYIALALLVAWILGMLGVFQVGKIVHVPLLVGLLLLLVAFLQARDAAGNSAK